MRSIDDDVMDLRRRTAGSACLDDVLPHQRPWSASLFLGCSLSLPSKISGMHEFEKSQMINFSKMRPDVQGMHATAVWYTGLACDTIKHPRGHCQYPSIHALSLHNSFVASTIIMAPLRPPRGPPTPRDKAVFLALGNSENGDRYTWER